MNKYLIELYSDLPSNDVIDCIVSPGSVVLDSDQTIMLVDFMIKNEIEFSVTKLEKCLVDNSYKYWEK